MMRPLVPYVLLALLLPGCDTRRAPAPGSDGAGEDPSVAHDTLLPVGDTRLFVHTEGVGEPVIVVHGGPLLDHGHMVRPLRPLTDEFRLVFYDQRLSGRSDGTSDSASLTLAGFADDIEAIRRSLGTERVHLLGHSWGGLIAMEYALEYPDRLRSLVLVSPMPPSAELWQQEEQALRESLEPADTAGMGALRESPGVAAGDPAAIESLLRVSFRSQLHDPAAAESLDFHIPDDYLERSRRFAALGADLATYDLVADLAALDVPTLVIHGADEIGGGTVAETLRTTIPGARVASVPDAGHFAFVERPDEFRRIVAAFLRDPGT